MSLPIFAHLQEENRRLRVLNTEMLQTLRAIIGELEGRFENPVLDLARRTVSKAESKDD